MPFPFAVPLVNRVPGNPNVRVSVKNTSDQQSECYVYVGFNQPTTFPQQPALGNFQRLQNVDPGGTRIAEFPPPQTWQPPQWILVVVGINPQYDNQNPPRFIGFDSALSQIFSVQA